MSQYVYGNCCVLIDIVSLKTGPRCLALQGERGGQNCAGTAGNQSRPGAGNTTKLVETE